MIDRSGDFEESFRGNLLDEFGRSMISGVMSSSELRFSKKYDNKSHVISYNLEMGDRGIWEGVYNSSNERVGGGRVICKTNLDWKSVNVSRAEYVNPETWAKSMIDSMVYEGYLEIAKDDETGKDVVIPR